MKAERITHWDGEKLFRGIDIFWWKNKEYRKTLAERMARKISNTYYRICWWIYDHSNYFQQIPEWQRFSWRFFRFGKQQRVRK